MEYGHHRRINTLGIISAVVLISSFAAGFILHEPSIEFHSDGDRILEESSNLSSLGPRVPGSNSEMEASIIISEMFEDAGLSDVQITEFEIWGSWLVEPDEGDEPIHMHAQIEQGIGNIPGLPDGSAGAGRVQISSTGDLEHRDAFTFLGYSGGSHKHDSEMVNLGSGTSEDFTNSGDLTDKAILIHHEIENTGRSLSDYYREAIEAGASVLMIYEEELESTYFQPIVVLTDDDRLISFPEAFPDYELIPFIFITHETAQTFIEFIDEAESDGSKYAILDGNWEAAQTGFTTVQIVTGELPGKSSKSVMIGANHDTSYLSEGQVDNSIGVAQLVEIARQLNGRELDRTVKFVSWGGEELGWLSSQAFLDQIEETQKPELYINIDSAILNEAMGINSFTVEASNNVLVSKAKSSAKTTFGGTGQYSANVIANNPSIDSIQGCSSHRSFNHAGIDTVGIGFQRLDATSSEIWPFCTDFSKNLDIYPQGELIDKEGAELVTNFVLEMVQSLNLIAEDKPIIEIKSLEGNSESWVFPFMIALMAGLATGIGGLIVILIKEISREMMSFMLGMAAGVMLLISIFDLWLGQAMEFGFVGISISFAFGASLVFLASILLRKNNIDEEMTEKKKMYMSGIFTAIALGIHNFPEGLAIGVAVLESAQYGIVLMVAIGLHNIPEGIAVAAPIQAGGGGKFKAVMIAFATGLTEPIGALFALLILGSILSPFIVGLSLAFVGGIMAVVSFKELIPQALIQERPRFMIVGMTFGAALMQLSLLLLN